MYFYVSEENSYEKKVIKFIKLYEKKVERVLNEVRLMRETSHANIIACEADFRAGPYWCLILPYSPDRSLLVYLINQEELFSESVVSFFMRQMLQSVDYLHDLGIWHRDVKLDNFIVFTKADNNVPKICLFDFGFAKKFNPCEKSDEFLGTLEYMAPEIVNKIKYDE